MSPIAYVKQSPTLIKVGIVLVMMVFIRDIIARDWGGVGMILGSFVFGIVLSRILVR